MNLLKLRRPARVLGLAGALALLSAVATAPPAMAHPRLVETAPAKGASAEAVTEVKLVFNENINVAEVVVRDEAGKSYQSGAARRSGTTVTQALTGELPAGTYTVAYRVVGVDGHPIESDDLAFTAGARPAPSAGGIGAEQQTGDAATADEQPLEIDQEQAAAEEDSGSGAVTWLLIIAGLLVGIGIGVGIVFRAKSKYRAATGGE